MNRDNINTFVCAGRQLKAWRDHPLTEQFPVVGTSILVIRSKLRTICYANDR